MLKKNDTIALEIVTTIHVDYNVDFQRWLPMLTANIDYQSTNLHNQKVSVSGTTRSKRC